MCENFLSTNKFLFLHDFVLIKDLMIPFGTENFLYTVVYFITRKVSYTFIFVVVYEKILVHVMFFYKK